MKRVQATLLTAIVFFAVSGGQAYAEEKPFEWPDYYTLEYVQTTADGTSTVKNYVRGSKVRIETSVDGTPPAVTFLDLDKEPSAKIPRLFDTEGNWKVIELEPDLTQYKITYGGKRKPVRVWLSNDAPMPMKMTSEDGSLKIEVRNYLPSPPSSSLFETPSETGGA